MIGLEPAPDELSDPGKLFRENPELLAYARSETKRLRENGLRGRLAETDHESQIRCFAIERMIGMFESENP